MAGWGQGRVCSMEPVYSPVIAFARGVFALQGLRFTILGDENVPTTGGAVMVINHIGYMDFTYAGYAAQRSGRLVRFMAKDSVFKHPVSGPLMRGMHHIPVDRTAGATSYRTAVNALRAGEIVGLPEATISRSFELKAFKSGAARMARDARVPIIPVVIWGSQRVWTKGHPKRLGRTNIPISISVGSRSRSPRAPTPTGSPPTTRPSWGTCSACSAPRTSASPGRTSSSCPRPWAAPHLPWPRRRASMTRSSPSVSARTHGGPASAGTAATDSPASKHCHGGGPREAHGKAAVAHRSRWPGQSGDPRSIRQPPTMAAPSAWRVLRAASSGPRMRRHVAQACAATITSGADSPVPSRIELRTMWVRGMCRWTPTGSAGSRRRSAMTKPATSLASWTAEVTTSHRERSMTR